MNQARNKECQYILVICEWEDEDNDVVVSDTWCNAVTEQNVAESSKKWNNI